VVGLTRQETRYTVKRMAVLHAEFWMDPHLEQQDWLPAHNFWFAQPDAELVEPFFQAYGVRLGESVSKICRAVLEQSEAINAAISERPWTLIHGDLRADNLLFGGTTESPAATILDWSWASRSMAAIDLAFLIGGSTPIPQRSGCLDELLTTWHEELLGQGVRDYSLADARRDLQLASLRALTTSVVVSSFDKKLDVNIRSSLLWDQAIQRHGAFVAELEAWQALPDRSLFT
jgi:thiamine kinase-like enzyme